MTEPRNCSLCGRASATAVCAWCGMVSDVGVAVEEAREMVRLGQTGGGTATVPAPPRVQDAAKTEAEDSTGEHVVELSCVVEQAASAGSPEPPDGMCLVPGGIFQFGEAKEPRYLDDYFVDRYPVTNGEYSRFVAETGHRPPRFWSGGVPPEGKADHPVVGVSLTDAGSFAEWAGTRIPTEEEWEKAARGSDGRVFPWGDFFCAGRSNVAGAGIKDTSSVALFREGASPSGCLDMAGNVWEWTVSPFRSGGRKHALKGGSWYDFSNYARCEGRFSAAADYEGNSVGFRCVIDIGGKRRVSRGLSIGGEYDDDVLAGCRARDGARRRPSASRRPADPESNTTPEPDTTPGPLMDLVENTMGALSAFDVGKARACMDEVFGDCAERSLGSDAIEAPDPTPEWTYSLPEARWADWVRPALHGLARLVPWCYRGARSVDQLFRTAPRWATLVLIMVIPLATFGLVWMGGVSSSGDHDREPDGTAALLAGSARPSAKQPESAEPEPRAAPVTAKPTPPQAIGVKPTEAPHATAPATTPPPGMVVVGAGSFVFGRDRTQRELGAFFIDCTEVTNAKYKEFVVAAGYPPPPHWAGPEIPPGTELHPVTNVDHADARAFADWAGKRLPTEEEWEKAARGTNGLRFPWGNQPDPVRANLFRPTAQFLGTRAVGTYPTGASPYGCQDMAGNVLEWTVTRFRGNFVLKGGSWGLSRDGGAAEFRYTHFPPETRTPMVGFRCVKAVEKKKE